ncbi:N-acetylmuramoyl-L-alanine amidase family protein [Bacillus toyonensis]
MGILFSASPLAGPLTESKVKADVDTFGTIVTTFGSIYDAFLAEPFGKWLEEIDVKNTYKASNENIAYKAPTFQKGEFGISVFDFYKDKSFSKKVKIAYANGKVEYKTIKHGEQIRIKDAGTIVDLTPDEADLSKHDILYITQKQLDEGNRGVSLTNFKTYYLKSDNNGGKNNLADRFEKQEFPHAFIKAGLRDVSYIGVDLFSKLPEEKRILATITSQPVSKEEMLSLKNSDTDTMNSRMADILTHHKEGEYASISVKIKTGESFLRSWEDGRLSKAVGVIPLGRDHFDIIPIKKGSNKVILKENLQYIPSALGSKGGYYNTIGPDKVWTLHDTGEKGLFVLQNDKGQYLSVDDSSAKFTDQYKEASLFNADLKREEWNNWLIKWYPGKENEKPRYDGVQIVTDEKDPTKKFAKNSSGDVIKNSWVAFATSHYYAGSDGVFVKGWHDIEGKTYYFGGDGAFKRGLINPDIDGKQYYFDYTGALQKSAWINKQYSDHTGAFVKEGLREIGGEIYYFQNYDVTTNELRLENQNIILHFSDKGVLEKASRPDGTELKGNNGNDGAYVTLDKKGLFFAKDGSIRKSGVSKGYAILAGENQPVLKYYSLEEGLLYSGWKEIDGKKYHFQDGIHTTFDGNEYIDGKKYYFNQEGQALPTGFIDIDGIPYYLNDKSEKVTGVHNIDGKLYLFSNGDKLRAYGEKVRNTIYSWDGNRYYTNHDGVISQNFKGTVYSHNRDYYIETNNEGVITTIWQR